MNLTDFIKESNKIEGIFRKPTNRETQASYDFLSLPIIEIQDLQNLVNVYQPGAVLRDKVGLDVRVGEHTPIKGGSQIRIFLQSILDNMEDYGPFQTHLYYENLHPFIDGNGRSGRMLWAWNMGVKGFDRGFLHEFYYQTLRNYEG